MTRTPTARRRPGFTLVELMVVMAVIIILSSIALLVVPSVLTQDRTTDAAGRVQQWLRLAQLRAARDGAARGVRLLGSSLGSGLVTECQYIETPPPVSKNFRIAINYGKGSGTPLLPLQEDLGGPHGIYVISVPPTTPASPPATDEANPGFLPPQYLKRGAYIPVPELEAALRIQQALPANTANPGYAYAGSSTTQTDTFALPAGITQLLRGNEKVVWKLVLTTNPAVTAVPGFDQPGPYSNSPDPSTGTAWNASYNAAALNVPTGNPLGYNSGTGPTTAASYPDLGAGVQNSPETAGGVKLLEGPFLVYPPPDPLLGEPVLQLAADTVIDLVNSRNGGATTGLTTAPVDLVFSPTGELTTLSGLSPGGQVFLWVRNKNGTGSTATTADFEKSGEQQLVAIKSRTGGLGVYPAAWDTTDPYKFAKAGLGQ